MRELKRGPSREMIDASLVEMAPVFDQIYSLTRGGTRASRPKPVCGFLLAGRDRSAELAVEFVEEILEEHDFVLLGGGVRGIHARQDRYAPAVGVKSRGCAA